MKKMTRMIPAGSYPRHLVRKVELLDGVWQFSFFETPGEFDPSGFVPDGLMAVPQAFDAMPDFRNKRGVGVYCRTILVAPGGHAFLEFESVGITAAVFVDGQPVAVNQCSFLRFEAEVPVSDREARTVIVVADNRFDETRAPLHAPNYDFRQYGGILGSVRLHHTPARRLRSLRVRGLSPLTGHVAVDLAIKGGGTAMLDAQVFVDGRLHSEEVLRFRDGLSSFDLDIESPQIWSPANPQLHLIRVLLPGVGDDMQVRTGLRTVEAREGEILLNQEPIRLAGVNRHESHPCFGSAVPESQMLADLMLLRSLGGNFVRGSHYPQSEKFLDLCDELGFLVWEEMLGWQQTEKEFAAPLYREAHRDGIARMISDHSHHPSIIMWGFLNEARTHLPEAGDILQCSFDQVRALDPSRLVTYATCKGVNDRFLELADVICFNTYPGWYNCHEDEGDPLRFVRPGIEKLVEFVSKHPVLRSRPIIISEIGAEGLYGVRDETLPFYSEDYQAAYIREVTDCVIEYPEICGIALWHFADIVTFSGGRSIMRPRGFNNKGLFNEYRRPKLAAAAAADLFEAFLTSPAALPCPNPAPASLPIRHRTELATA